MPVVVMHKSKTKIKWSDGAEIYRTLSTTILLASNPASPTNINIEPYFPKG